MTSSVRIQFPIPSVETRMGGALTYRTACAGWPDHIEHSPAHRERRGQLRFQQHSGELDLDARVREAPLRLAENDAFPIRPPTNTAVHGGPKTELGFEPRYGRAVVTSSRAAPAVGIRQSAASAPIGSVGAPTNRARPPRHTARHLSRTPARKTTPWP